MDVPGRAAAAISRMEQVRREMAERRALRHRNGMAVREKSRDSLQKHGLALAKAVAEAETVDRGTSHVMSLGLPDDEPATEQPAAERSRRARHRALDDEEDYSNQSSWMTHR